MFVLQSQEPPGLFWRKGDDDATAQTPTSSCTTPQTREIGSSSDDWSDPRQYNAGVLIPELLQPLLGLDFVPYLPPREVSSPEITSRRSGCSRPDVEEEEEECLTENDDEDDTERSAQSQSMLTLDTTGIEVELQDTVTPTMRRKAGKKSLGSAIRKALRMKRKQRRTFSDEDTSQSNIRITPVSTTVFSDATPRRRGRRHIDEGSSSGGGAKLDSLLEQQQAELARIQSSSLEAQKRANSLVGRISSLHSEVSNLQKSLQASTMQLKKESSALEETNRELVSLEEQAVRSAKSVEESIQQLLQNDAKVSRNNNLQQDELVSSQDGVRQRSFSSDLPRTAGDPLGFSSFSEHSALTDDTPPLAVRRRAHTEPRGFRRSSSSFMRVQDLPICRDNTRSVQSAPSVMQRSDSDFFFIDQDIPLVLDGLFDLGFHVVTDETARFEPTRDTNRLLKANRSLVTEPLAQWPIVPWHVASNDIYVWTGGVPHKGFGHDWPVVKARTIVRCTPRKLLDFLLDSSQIRRYNKMSQGREDVLILQEGVEVTTADSIYGIPGDVRILRTLTKPKLLPKTIEVLSMWYSKPLEDAPGSYMIVNRSVFEDDSGLHKASDEDRMLRSEMLLGVFLLRSLPNDACELTTITHVFSPGVPERMAKRFAPGTAANMLRDIQTHFVSK